MSCLYVAEKMTKFQLTRDVHLWEVSIGGGLTEMWCSFVDALCSEVLVLLTMISPTSQVERFSLV